MSNKRTSLDYSQKPFYRVKFQTIKTDIGQWTCTRLDMIEDDEGDDVVISWEWFEKLFKGEDK